MKKIHFGELLLHVIMFSFYAYTYANSIFIPGSSDTYGGERKFFTKWNLYLTVAYFAYAILVDLINLFITESDSSRNFRTLVFCSNVVPSTMITSLVFWGIYAIEPELMLPAWIQKFMPIDSFYNHAVHTAPIITTSLECFFVFHRPPRTLHTMLTWVLYAIAYLSWILWVAYHSGIWVYPFLEVMPNSGRAMFFGGVFVFGCVLGKIGEVFIYSVSGTENEKQKKKD